MERTPTHKAVAIDIDGVILDSMHGEFVSENYDPLDLDKHPTMKGCIRVLSRLVDNGFTVILYTSRTNPDWHGNGGYTVEELMEGVEANMRKRNIPFHFLAKFKPIVDLYLDDRGWHFRDWSQAEKDFEMLGYLPKTEQ
jgi:hypothetical protein